MNTKMDTDGAAVSERAAMKRAGVVCWPAKSDAAPDRMWRRGCALALLLSALSLVLCTLTWLENSSMQRRLLLVESQLAAQADDGRLQQRIESLLQQQQLESSSSSSSTSSSSPLPHVRTARQVSSGAGECVCPPGKPLPRSIHHLHVYRFGHLSSH